MNTNQMIPTIPLRLTLLTLVILLSSCSKEENVAERTTRVQIIDYSSFTPIANAELRSYNVKADGSFNTIGTITPGKNYIADANGFVELGMGVYQLEFVGLSHWNPFLKTGKEFVGGWVTDFQNGKQYFFPQGQLELEIINKSGRASLAHIEISLSVVSDLNGVVDKRKYWSEVHPNSPNEIQTSMKIAGGVTNYLQIQILNGLPAIDTVLEIRPEKQLLSHYRFEY